MANDNRSIDLSHGYRCLTADIITEYLSQEGFGGLGLRRFRYPVIRAADELTESTQCATYFK